MTAAIGGENLVLLTSFFLKRRRRPKYMSPFSENGLMDGN